MIGNFLDWRKSKKRDCSTIECHYHMIAHWKKYAMLTRKVQQIYIGVELLKIRISLNFLAKVITVCMVTVKLLHQVFQLEVELCIDIDLITFEN
jgi:hypothetical protein